MLNYDREPSFMEKEKTIYGNHQQNGLEKDVQ